jgi:hypothetical protein
MRSLNPVLLDGILVLFDHCLINFLVFVALQLQHKFKIDEKVSEAFLKHAEVSILSQSQLHSPVWYARASLHPPLRSARCDMPGLAFADWHSVSRSILARLGMLGLTLIQCWFVLGLQMDRLREDLKHLQEQYACHPEVLAKMAKIMDLEGGLSLADLVLSLPSPFAFNLGFLLVFGAPLGGSR